MRVIAERIRMGEPYLFRTKDVQGVVDQMQATRALNPSSWTLIVYLLRLFLPGIIFIAILIILERLLHYLR